MLSYMTVYCQISQRTLSTSESRPVPAGLLLQTPQGRPGSQHDSHQQLSLGTEEASVVASASETNGALFAINLRMHPGGGPPVMHRHDPGEVYYVIDGEFTFYVQDMMWLPLGVDG